MRETDSFEFPYPFMILENRLSHLTARASRTRVRSAARTPVSTRPVESRAIYGTRSMQRQRTVRRRRRWQNSLLVFAAMAFFFALFWRWNHARLAVSGSAWNLKLSQISSAAPLLRNDALRNQTLLIPTFGGPLLQLKLAPHGAPVERTFFASDFALRAAPVALGENVVVTDEAGNVFALDNNGKTLWKFRASTSISTRPVTIRVLDGARENAAIAPDSASNAAFANAVDAPPSSDATPKNQPKAFAKTSLIVGDDGGQIVALNARDGKLLWKRELGAPIGNALAGIAAPNAAAPDAFAPNAAAPNATLNSVATDSTTLNRDIELNSEAQVLVPLLGDARSRGGVVCLDARSGAVLWKIGADAAILPAPSVGATRPKGAQIRVFLGADDGSVWCLEMGNGKTVWKIRLSSTMKAPNAVSLRGEPLLKVFGWGARLFLVGNDGVARCLDARDGREIWSFRSENVLPQRPLFLQLSQNGTRRDTVLVAGARRLCALDARSGALLWSAPTQGEIAVFAADKTSVWSISREGTAERFELR